VEQVHYKKFLDKNVVLPKDAKPSDTDKLYKVYYSFFVDEKGALSDISMIKSNCKACEESIVAAIKKTSGIFFRPQMQESLKK
jgi:hypothetical protein